MSEEQRIRENRKQLEETADGARTFMFSWTHTRSWLLLWSVHPEVERAGGVSSSLCALIRPLSSRRWRSQARLAPVEQRGRLMADG